MPYWSRVSFLTDMHVMLNEILSHVAAVSHSFTNLNPIIILPYYPSSSEKGCVMLSEACEVALTITNRTNCGIVCAIDKDYPDYFNPSSAARAPRAQQACMQHW